MNLQGEILEASGGSWYSPPAAVDWSPEHFERARAILAEHAGSPVWGFKDPRTVLTFERMAAAFCPTSSRSASSGTRSASRSRSGTETTWPSTPASGSGGPTTIVSSRSTPRPRSRSSASTRIRRRSRESSGRPARLVGLGGAPPDEPFFTDELRNAPAEGDSVPAEIEALYERLREHWLSSARSNPGSSRA